MYSKFVSRNLLHVALLSLSVSSAYSAQKQKGAPRDLIGYFTQDIKYCPGNTFDNIEGIDNRLEIKEDFFGACSGSWCGSDIKSSEKTPDGYRIYAVGQPSGTKYSFYIKMIDQNHIVYLDKTPGKQEEVLMRCAAPETYKATVLPIRTVDPNDVFGSECKIDSAQFERIDIGNSYEDVKSVIGCAGKQIAVSYNSGHKSIMYGWDGFGKAGANSQIVFLDGNLSTKSQIGLR